MAKFHHIPKCDAWMRWTPVKQGPVQKRNGVIHLLNGNEINCRFCASWTNGTTHNLGNEVKFGASSPYPIKLFIATCLLGFVWSMLSDWEWNEKIFIAFWDKFGPEDPEKWRINGENCTYYEDLRHQVCAYFFSKYYGQQIWRLNQVTCGFQWYKNIQDFAVCLVYNQKFIC